MVIREVQISQQGSCVVKLTSSVDVLTGISNKWSRNKALLVGSIQHIACERR